MGRAPDSRLEGCRVLCGWKGAVAGVPRVRGDGGGDHGVGVGGDWCSVTPRDSRAGGMAEDRI